MHGSSYPFIVAAASLQGWLTEAVAFNQVNTAIINAWLWIDRSCLFKHEHIPEINDQAYRIISHYIC